MAQNQKQALFARGFLLAALLIAAWAVVTRTGVKNTDEAGVVMALPSTVGAWHGQPVWHCSSTACGRSWLAEELVPGTSACPACGAPLDVMNPAERYMLPADTGLTRFYYLRDTAPHLPVFAAIVLSGNDRTSIHRPQVCMVAAGWEIVDERVFSVDLGPGKTPLELTVLDMTHPPAEPGGPLRHIFYAYWFVGKGRLCATHVQRMWWMAYDRIVHGVNHRWAYVSVSGDRDPSNDGHLQTIANFVSQFHPQILRPDFADLDDSQGKTEP